MIDLDPAGSRTRVPISRATDRRITFAGMVVAVGYVVAALLSMALPERIRLGSWLPLHLVLAGAATTAIVSVLPFFTAALAAAQPARPTIRIAAIVLVGCGAISTMIVHGHGPVASAIGLAAGGAYIAGLGLAAVGVFSPIRRRIARRWRPLEIAYGIALANVAVGATIATLLLAGQPGVAASWISLKPAHAWLNLFGFVSLTVGATLVHLAPTIAGTRIVPRRSALVALAGLGVGPSAVALGYILGWDLLARLGAGIVTVGAVALAIHGWGVQRAATAWTTDREWHRFSGISMVAAVTWFAIGASVAGGRTIVSGIDIGTWTLTPILAPLIVGFVVQVLIGAWTHLLPAIGPGDPARHAQQRILLSRWGTSRLIGLNVGCLALWLGSVGAWPEVTAAGGLLSALSVAASLALFARAAIRSATPRPAAPRP